jgi:hypothetical protein
VKLFFVRDEGWVICNDEDYRDTGGSIEINNGYLVNIVSIPLKEYKEQASADPNFFLVAEINERIANIAMIIELTNNMTPGPILYRRETIVKEATPSKEFETWVLSKKADLVVPSLTVPGGGKVIDFSKFKK